MSSRLSFSSHKGILIGDEFGEPRRLCDVVSRMIKRTLFLLLALTMGALAEGQVTIGKVQWYTNYDEAMKVARKVNKPLWLHFGENPG